MNQQNGSSENAKKVSIVVPVYNSEKTLARCVESIISQTYVKLEIILVDDGSTDTSGAICDKYTEIDGRVSVIHKDNGGLVSARKCGIKAATGDYVLNVDSDDWVEPEMVEYLLGKAVEDESDIVTSGYYRENNSDVVEVFDLFDEGVYFGEKLALLQNKMIFKDCVSNRGISPCIWCKLFKADVIKEISARMPNEIRFAEDGACVYCCMLIVTKVTVTKKAFYHYIMYHDSMIRSVDEDFFRNLNCFYRFMRGEADRFNCNQKIRKQIDVYISEHCLIGMNYLIGLQKNTIIPFYYFKNISGIKETARVIVYAAGAVGQSYINDFLASKRFEIVAWVDKEDGNYQRKGLNVCPIEEITKQRYDYIIIAVKFEGLANRIRARITKEFNVPDERIVWENPACILDRYVDFEEDDMFV